MKKIATILISVCLCMMLASCGGSKQPETTTAREPATQAAQPVQTQTTTEEVTTEEPTTVYTETYAIIAPAGADITVGGVKVTDADIVGTGVPSVAEYSSQFTGGIVFNRYEVQLEPAESIEISGTDAEGNALAFTQGDHLWEAGVVCGDGFVSAVSGIVEGGLKAYAEYFVYISSNLKPYILSSCNLYSYIFGPEYDWINVTFYNYENITAHSFSEFSADNYICYGDSCFTVDVRYKLDLTFDGVREDNNQKLDATWVWVRDGDSWSISDMNYHPDYSVSYPQYEGVKVVQINEKTFSGILLMVADPSAVICGVIPGIGSGSGYKINAIMEEYEANGYSLIGGVNGGDFVDTGTYILTGVPLGAVMSEGEVVFQDAGYDTSYRVVGLTNDNQLVMGSYTIYEMQAMGMREAIHCETDSGPFLVENGEICSGIPVPSEYGAGKNARTAIGQNANGVIMLLSINGRQADSLGASFEDLAAVMKKYGAVTAAAMDGGSSAQMSYKMDYGFDYINHPYSPAYGPRACPTFWLIKSN